MPAKVEAALQFCRFCHGLELGCQGIDGRFEG